MAQIKRKLLAVVMDGVGESEQVFGNAVKMARTPNLDWLKSNALFTTLRAHGTAVGLPSDSDLGNSEVGHNAFGAGKVYDQGAKLVSQAIESGSLFEGDVWKKACSQVIDSCGTLHLMGLLSDGNVHSHQDHLHALVEKAIKEGIKRIRVHALLDGRDVPPRSADVYIDRLESFFEKIRETGLDVAVASGGGRMKITMDRYEADWSMVEEGWKIHVKGDGPKFSSLKDAVVKLREKHDVDDQYLPGFVVDDPSHQGDLIQSGDSVLFFNFRGDRAIEISRTFSEKEFSEFPRGPLPDIFYAGMMEYDGDLHIPTNYLVSPPLIKNTLGEYLASQGVKQFACSETQKFGHVTFFWNGNKSGYFDQSLETYVQLDSDLVPFDQKPWMKAAEITEATIQALGRPEFEFGRINFANGDMVGHTGDFNASVIAVETVDYCLGRLLQEVKRTKTILVVMSDHGNADQMFQGKDATKFPLWETGFAKDTPESKTSHTLSLVPFIIYDPTGSFSGQILDPGQGSIAQFANTALKIMGLAENQDYLPSVVQ